MADPVASRPRMPGYGILPADQGTGLLHADFTGSPTCWSFPPLREA